MSLLLFLFLFVVVNGDLRTDYNNRVNNFLDTTARSSDSGAWSDLARLAVGYGIINGSGLRNSMNNMAQRLDCSDFDVPAMVHILMKYGNSSMLPADLKSELQTALLNWQYWIDEYEPMGQGNMMFWTENHQMDFHVSEYLAGYLFFNLNFPGTNMTGEQHMNKAKFFINQWLTRRYRWGHSEWKSDDYLQFQVRSVATLASLAPDEDIQKHATMILDLLLYDLSIHSYAGGVASSRGRAYASAKWNMSSHSIGTVINLLKSNGFTRLGDGAAVSLSLCNTFQYYIVPEVVLAIAADNPEEFESRERIGIDTSEVVLAKETGNLGYSTADDGIGWWGLEAYATPDTIGLGFVMGDTWNLYGTNETTWNVFEIFKPLWEKDPDLVRYAVGLAWPFSSSVLGNASIYIYRTPDTVLSSALDFRPGVAATQEHVWQATLSSTAIVFTTQPGPNVDPTYYLNSLTFQNELYNAIMGTKNNNSKSTLLSNNDNDLILPLNFSAMNEEDKKKSIFSMTVALLQQAKKNKRIQNPENNNNNNSSNSTILKDENDVDYADGYWTGSASMPRIGQYKNFSLILYNPPWNGEPKILFPNHTHAYFPKSEFDIVQDYLNASGWVFGAKGNGYIGLYTSSKDIKWNETTQKEIIAEGAKNVWICVVGRTAVDGSFETFTNNLLKSQIILKSFNDTLDVSFFIPATGLSATFGWNSPLVIIQGDGTPFTPPLYHPKRYLSPYMTADFPATTLSMKFSGSSLFLDYDKEVRIVQDAL